ncbi:class II aldolase/adducin family protein [Selenomonas sputigena]|uniref:Class II aldolase/adducin family protein n=1 Tax=Selenomonas sputigena TaxID=69823 RepID=A0ABV3X3V1_9FIRM
MNEGLQQKFTDAIWVAKSLFERNKTSGSSANMSFRHEGKIFITASGTCFGRLTQDDFACIDSEGHWLGKREPSKEFPLHRMLFQKSETIQCVIHTHSTYSVLWSCLDYENLADIVPDYTPYLKMKVGRIGCIPYAAPGSQELFELFRERIHESDGYILKNHGPILGGKSILDAFYGLEELEESTRIAWLLREEKYYAEKRNS